MNSSNETFYPIDFWFSLYGFPHVQDIIIVYIITPFWVTALILSSFSFFVMLKAPFFHSSFFKYMRLYVLSNSLLSLLSTTSFIQLTRHIFSFTNTEAATFYGNYVFAYAQSSLFSFSSLIEICLAAERILGLLPRRFKKIKILGFNKFFSISFIACVLVNITAVLLFEPAYADIQLENNAVFRLWYYGITSLSSTSTGAFLSYFGYVFRDILPMIAKIVLNTLLVYLIRSYVKRKQRISTTANASNAHLASIDQRQTYISLIMSTFSLLEHILYITSFIQYFFNDYDVANFIYTFAAFSIAVKLVFNFFILLIFNNLFRNEVRNIFSF